MVKRIQTAKPAIIQTLERMPHVLRVQDVARVFSEHREGWRLAKSTGLREFTDFLTQKTSLRPLHVDFPARTLTGYTWGEVPLMEALLGLLPASFYSHYTALRLHGLTEQVPKTLYLNQEKSRPSATAPEPVALTQADIDAAFARPPRISNQLAKYGDLRIMLLASSDYQQRGVTEGDVNLGDSRPLHLRYTGLERTLIDCVVRPFYAGGVFEVAQAFERAREQASVNALAALLRHMHLLYPYHQALGYYLERAGYKPAALDLLRRLPMERDFYLTHAMGSTRYVPEWRLHVPQGL
jgi:hypothetical protein